ncbi:hypothetical protein CR513_30533, partial [Mucuna pruriens]
MGDFRSKVIITPILAEILARALSNWECAEYNIQVPFLTSFSFYGCFYRGDVQVKYEDKVISSLVMVMCLTINFMLIEKNLVRSHNVVFIEDHTIGDINEA